MLCRRLHLLPVPSSRGTAPSASQHRPAHLPRRALSPCRDGCSSLSAGPHGLNAARRSNCMEGTTFTQPSWYLALQANVEYAVSTDIYSICWHVNLGWCDCAGCCGNTPAVVLWIGVARMPVVVLGLGCTKGLTCMRLVFLDLLHPCGKCPKVCFCQLV